MSAHTCIGGICLGKLSHVYTVDFGWPLSVNLRIALLMSVFFGSLAFVIQDVNSPARSRPNTEKKFKTRECNNLATYTLFTSRAEFQQRLAAGNWKGRVLGTNVSIDNMHPYMMMHGKVVSGNLCNNSLIRCNEEFWYVVAHLSLNLQSCETQLCASVYLIWFSVSLPLWVLLIRPN